MEWSEIKIEVPLEYTETASAIANMVVPYGIYIEDYSDLEIFAPQIAHVDYIDEELTAKDRTISIIHIYIDPTENPMESVSFIKERLESENVPFKVVMNNVKDEDWNEVWKKYYHPTKIGEKIVICPSWEEYEKRDGEVVVKLDPGMAFGTGTHDTTRLCMTLLEKYTKKDTSVLDIGTGSGILAITAKLLGASDVCGCDIDKLATIIAGENANMNGVENSIEFYHGNLLEHCIKKYDIVCANIVADIILNLIPDVHNALNDDGIFIISGIIEMRTDDIISALDNYGYNVIEQIDNGGWFAFACKKR